MSPTDPATLAISGELTVGSAAARWRELLPRMAGIRIIDLAAVEAIDSAGLALLQALRQAAQAQGELPGLQNVPERMRRLCVAHRVEISGH